MGHGISKTNDVNDDSVEFGGDGYAPYQITVHLYLFSTFILRVLIQFEYRLPYFFNVKVVLMRCIFPLKKRGKGTFIALQK